MSLTLITNDVIALSTIAPSRLSQGAPTWSTTGELTAFKFIGDGSALTNLPVTNTTVFATVSTLQVSGVASFTTTTEQGRTVTIASSAASLDLNSAALFLISLNSNVSASFVNPPPAPRVCSFTVAMSADGTARAVTWPTSVRWAAGTPPTITSTANKVDIFSFLTNNGGSSYYGFTSDQNF